MNKRFYNLRFLIGLFFGLLAVILLAGYALSAQQRLPINGYTGLVFLIFGLLMMWKTAEGEEAP